MRIVFRQPKAPVAPLGGLLQRQCACGNHADGSECAECSKKKRTLERAARDSGGTGRQGDAAPSIVHEVLRSPGEALDSRTRAFMGERFAYDFSAVAVHTDAAAAESAGAVNALAYTVGSNVAFARGLYQPHTAAGRRLLAHELAHVVQQRGDASGSSAGTITIGRSDTPTEREARTMSEIIGAGRSARATLTPGVGATLNRADPNATGYVTRLGNVEKSGIQFFPTNVTDTQVGPVTIQGGLLHAGASRLQVIIGQNLTPRRLARQLVPLWNTATPFTPPGGGAPVPVVPITELELAQALLVYNQTYLPVPAMTNWRAGLRFPLPVEIDELTGIATLHGMLIQQLATGFNPTWLPQLDQRATAVAAIPAATLRADVTAFLARETTASARGIHLGARALTNAVAERPFVREAFRQLGPGSFDVALEFMDNLVNREVSVLAAQRDGAAILTEIRAALGAAPAAPSATQQASLDRANLMLGLVAGATPEAQPVAARTRPEKAIAVDTVKLDGSTHNPSTQVDMANAILSQCNVRVTHGVNATATNAQTTGWLGGDTTLSALNACGSVSTEERGLYTGASAAFGLGARYRAFFVAGFNGIRASGYSEPPYCATGSAAPFRYSAYVANGGDSATLAHELGHILINSGAHPVGTVMGSRPAAPARRRPRFTDPQCTTLHSNA